MTNAEKSDVTPDNGSATPLDENYRMQAFIDEEQATKTETWWESSPWGGKNPAHWELEEIKFFKTEYEATRNPVFVWAALQIALALPQPEPEQAMLFREARRWIDEYLRDCTNQLLSATKEPPHRDVGTAIAKVFGFTFDVGRGSPLSDGQKRLRDRQLALEGWRRLPFERYKETLAVAHVASVNGVSESVVGDAWRDFKKQVSR